MTRHTETDQDGALAISRTEFDYDDYGRLALRYERGDPAPAADGDDRWVEWTYEMNGSLFLSTMATENGYSPREAGALWTHTYCYDGARGGGCNGRATRFGDRTATRIFSPMHRTELVEETEFDRHGNVTLTVDAEGRATRFDYDSYYHAFATDGWNALDHHQQFEWDYTLGQITRVIDVSNGITLGESTFDPLGRRIADRDISGTIEETEYLDIGDPRTQRVRRTIRSTGQWAENDLDGLGRVRRSERSGSRGVEVQTTSYEDAESGPQMTSSWHALGDLNPPRKTFHYDYLGRTDRVTHADGSFRRTEHRARRTIQYDERDVPIETQYDGRGRKIALLERHLGAARATRFEWNAADLPERVIDPAGNVTEQSWDILGPGQGLLRSEFDPDRGLHEYRYDRVGNLTFSQDDRGTQMSIHYDALHRPISQNVVGSGRVLEWRYDEPGHGASIGRRTRTIDPDAGSTCGEVSEELYYDDLGRPSEARHCWAGSEHTMGLTYDVAGRVAERVYGALRDRSAERVAYDYDPAGRLFSANGYVQRIEYHPNGRIAFLEFTNGTVETYDYSPEREWLTGVTVDDGAGSTLFAEGIDIRVDGLVETQRLCGVGGVGCGADRVVSSFGYDDQRRLTGMSRVWPTGALNQRFEYDAAGNMSFHSDLGNMTYPRYGAGVRYVHAASSAGGRTFQYDAVGNLEYEFDGGVPTRGFQWNRYGKLERVDVYSLDGSEVESTVEYEYDAELALRRSVSDTAEHIFLFPEVQFELGASSETTYSYFIGTRRIATRTGEVVTFHHADHLGSTAITTQDSASVPTGGRFEYGAFGSLLDGDPEVSDDFAFTGARQDGDSAALDPTGAPSPGGGLILLGARPYDPTTARFIAPDSIMPGDHLMALHRYAYAFSNPINLIDPSGHAPAAREREEQYERTVYVIHETCDQTCMANAREILRAQQRGQTRDTWGDRHEYVRGALNALGAQLGGIIEILSAGGEKEHLVARHQPAPPEAIMNQFRPFPTSGQRAQQIESAFSWAFFAVTAGLSWAHSAVRAPSGIRGLLALRGTGAVREATVAAELSDGAAASTTATAGAESAQAPRLYGPFHRLQSAADNELMVQTQQAGGRATRNNMAGLAPAVKAYAGPLPEGAAGIEFYTPVAPARGSTPHIPFWYGEYETSGLRGFETIPGTPGVITQDDLALIPITIARTVP